MTSTNSLTVASESPVKRIATHFIVAIVALGTLAAFHATRATAVGENEELTRFGNEGTAAGQMELPDVNAIDPTTGHVYIFDSNSRINEFTPWGRFVKAFGWNVAAGTVNEQQEIRVRASAGQFRLSFDGDTTTDLAFNAAGSGDVESVEASLNALSSISGSGANVSVQEVPGTPNGITPYIYVITFKGSLAGQDVPQITVSQGGAPLNGGDPSTSLESKTRADGAQAGAGLEPCTAESTCQSGAGGSGAGQLSSVSGLAFDSGGDLYVRETSRVQKFDSAGRFLLMFGHGVDEGPHHPGDVCTAANLAEGDSCGPGSQGSGVGEIGTTFSDIAVGPDGTVFVGDNERIDEFTSNGAWKGEIEVPGQAIGNLAISADGASLYLIFNGSKNVHKISVNTGAEIGQLSVSEPKRVKVDASGNVYVSDGFDGTFESQRILQFSSSGTPLSPPSFGATEHLENVGINGGVFLSLRGLGVNALGDVYAGNDFPPAHRSFVRAFGPGPVIFEGPPPAAPTVAAQFASTVQRDGATLFARINPHFWTDTRYYVQYGLGKCSEGHCETQKPLAPGALLTAKAVDAPVQTAGAFIEGLEPNSTYHYRFVAESGGGGPTFGEEATFITFSASFAKRSCSNDVFRFGFSALLPDCRAYELVSPVNKAGGDVKIIYDELNYSTALTQSSADGNGFTYTSYRAFADPEAAPYVAQVLAWRNEGSGWENKGISPPQGVGATRLYGLSADLDNQYWAFSSDLCQGWLSVPAEPPLAPGGKEDSIDLYRRKNCEGGYETVAPGVFAPELQGTSADGSAVVLRVNDGEGLAGVSRTYYASKGALHPLCVLPSGQLSANYCSAGYDPHIAHSGTGDGDLGHLGVLTNAVSADGSRVYWTDSGASSAEVQAHGGSGTIYLRENPAEDQSEVIAGECTEPEKACTVAVSGTKTSKSARFLGASKDGSRAIFEVTEGPASGKLYEFELGGETRELGGNTLGVAGMSDDLSRVYFVSEKAFVDTTGATAGKPNLYLDEEGTRTFIATLSRADITLAPSSNVSIWSIYHAARASSNGQSLAFISNKSLTGYDNTDAASAVPCGVTEGSREGVCDSEVYLYEAGAGAPVCISCNPSGARPQGQITERRIKDDTKLQAAATLPMANNQLYLPKGISTDGSRVFFNSYDALLPRDTNGKEDVYEWERGSSQQQCEEDNAELFVEASGGCLSLISSGESPQDSEVLDSSADGRDVFFTTNASLLPQDPGLIDVYDAREGGGFSQPIKAAACEGEACQGPYSPPNDPTPASSSFQGAGNVVERPARKGRKHKRKHAHKAKQKKRAAKHNRGGRN